MADAYDDDGVRHQLWVLSDPDSIAAIAEAVATAPVVIADGHHRYETARTFAAECRAANGDQPGPYDLILALVVELAEDQLTVGAIHRTICGPAGRLRSDRGLLALVRRGAGRRGRRPHPRRAGRLQLAGPGHRRRRLPAAAPCPRPTRKRATTSIPASSPSPWPTSPRTRRSTGTAWPRPPTRCADGGAQAAFLLRPVTVGQIEEWAGEPAPHAAEDHLLQPQAPDRHGVPLPGLLVPARSRRSGNPAQTEIETVLDFAWF